MRAAPHIAPGSAQTPIGEASTIQKSVPPRRVPVNDKLMFQRFDDFYPFYLGEHVNRICRRLHFAGTTIAAVLLVTAILTQRWWLVAVALVQGYAFALIGHFFFEHNKPATFKHPLFSLMGDWRLWWDILTGRQRM